MKSKANYISPKIEIFNFSQNLLGVIIDDAFSSEKVIDIPDPGDDAKKNTFFDETSSSDGDYPNYDAWGD